MSLKEKINLVKQQLEINEIDTMALEKTIGKKLVDYESIDALVAALMGYYNPLVDGINKTFRNFCPFKVGDIYLTTNSINPSSIFLGTTWQKIENAMLRATSSGQASKQVGGSDTVALSVANLAPHTHSASTASHTHSRGTMDITGYISPFRATYGGSPTSSGAFTYTQPSATMAAQGATTDNFNIAINFQASRSWSGVTSGASPVTSVGSTGSGAAFSVVNRYYSVHVWLRLS
ncbi:phage baseplate protein [Fusobacterium necrogenes]|uniref:phage baseplate protein n=1 Tax=Fusobacterium necrogenes TaxID=858 RepID=UPI00255C2DC0|nr:hypothetical protein [Fusobacterium necrogenes]